MEDVILEEEQKEEAVAEETSNTDEKLPEQAETAE